MLEIVARYLQGGLTAVNLQSKNLQTERSRTPLTQHDTHIVNLHVMQHNTPRHIQV